MGLAPDDAASPGTVELKAPGITVIVTRGSVEHAGDARILEFDLSRENVIHRRR
jgi:hypothetical protein